MLHKLDRLVGTVCDVSVGLLGKATVMIAAIMPGETGRIIDPIGRMLAAHLNVRPVQNGGGYFAVWAEGRKDPMWYGFVMLDLIENARSSTRDDVALKALRDLEEMLKQVIALNSLGTKSEWLNSLELAITEHYNQDDVPRA